MSETIYIATRKSPLALWQATTTQKLLADYNISSELVKIVTTGDKLQHSQLSSVTLTENQPQHLSTGKGLFIKEIQEALKSQKAHLAVHSMKDLPVEQTHGLVIGALLPRASPNDVLVLAPKVLEEIGLKNTPLYKIEFETLKSLLLKSNLFLTNPIGTTSSRRQFLMKRLYSNNLNLQILRGNVGSRLKKLKDNEYSAILLAQAGLERLNLFEQESMHILPTSLFIPATAQGIIAIECDINNTALLNTLQKINSFETCITAGIERMVLYFLEGDCNSSIGVHYSHKNIAIIYGKSFKEKSFLIPISLQEEEELKSLLVSSNGVYSYFFKKLLQSALANRIKLIITG